MGKWKISGMVTDETPSPWGRGLVTLVAGIWWLGDAPVTMDLTGEFVVGSLKLYKSEKDGRPCIMGEGEVTIDGLNDSQWLTLGRWGFAMCGIVEAMYHGEDVDIATKTRVTNVALQPLTSCFSKDYVVAFEPIDESVGATQDG